MSMTCGSPSADSARPWLCSTGAFQPGRPRGSGGRSSESWLWPERYGTSTSPSDSSASSTGTESPRFGPSSGSGGRRPPGNLAAGLRQWANPAAWRRRLLLPLFARTVRSSAGGGGGSAARASQEVAGGSGPHQRSRDHAKLVSGELRDELARKRDLRVEKFVRLWRAEFAGTEAAWKIDLDVASAFAERNIPPQSAPGRMAASAPSGRSHGA